MITGLLLLFTASVSLASDECLDLFANRGLAIGASQSAVTCYEEQFKRTTDKITQANALNQLSHLQFFIASNEDKANEDAKLKQAVALAERSVLLFGPWLNEPDYSKLESDQRRLLTEALYSYGTTLARLSEKQGTLIIVAKWPTIQKVMRLVTRLGHAEVAGYGGHRTLAIANSRMPAPFGDKKLAEQYLKFAIEKSNRQGHSSYLVNHNMLADLYFRQDRKVEACAQLAIIANLTNETIAAQTEAGVYEGLRERSMSQSLLKDKCSR